MRLVKVTGPEGYGKQIIDTAFASGIENATLRVEERHSSGGKVEHRDAVDVETSTPNAKRFVSNVLKADYFSRDQITINTRQPRSIISNDDIHSLTAPLSEPTLDITEEFWQFSHVTYGLVARVLIAAGLLAYGLIGQKILLMMAGLLFLPLLPMVMAIAMGLASGTFRLALQGIGALSISTGLLVAGGAVVAILSEPPLQYSEFDSFWVSLIITAVVGVAAALAVIDDVGRRELIGLAAAAQIGIAPVWLGICIVFGAPASTSGGDVQLRVFSHAANLLVLIATTAIVLTATGMTSGVKRMHRS
jgi:hypothetical protein